MFFDYTKGKEPVATIRVSLVGVEDDIYKYSDHEEAIRDYHMLIGLVNSKATVTLISEVTNDD